MINERMMKTKMKNQECFEENRLKQKGDEENQKAEGTSENFERISKQGKEVIARSIEKIEKL